jgi:hypothetical protein
MSKSSAMSLFNNRSIPKVGTAKQPWIVYSGTADDFLLKMLEYGKPIETSLVGVFDDRGRGSRRDVPLPFHRDGDYSKDMAAKHNIDVVGLYCIRDGGNVETLIKYDDNVYRFQLCQGQGIIFDNHAVLHAREGAVADRLLLRVWIESPDRSKWYNCAHCDAGYPDQECICDTKG